MAEITFEKIFPLRLIIKEWEWVLLWIAGSKIGLAVVPTLSIFAIIVGLQRRWRKSACCSNCGYPLIHLPEPRCPECGRRFDPDSVAPTVMSQHRATRFMEPAYLIAASAWAIFWWGVTLLGPSRYWFSFDYTAVPLALSYLLVAALPGRAYPMRGWIALSVLCIIVIEGRLGPRDMRQFVGMAYIFCAPALAVSIFMYQRLFGVPRGGDLAEQIAESPIERKSETNS